MPPRDRLLRVCITGPEATGKTTLAAHLAGELRTAWVPEASRLYAEQKGAPLLAADVDPIARLQLGLDDAGDAEARARGAGHLVLDTDLLSTVVYARHYYGAAPGWVERAERARRADLYLLCDIDVPWTADGIRDRPHHREELFDTFRAALARRRANVVLVRGDWAARRRVAAEAIAALGG